MSRMIIGGISGDQLKQYIDRIEQLEFEKKQTLECIRDVYSDAKSNGLDVKIMRQLIKERQIDKEKLTEQEELLEIYKEAIGMKSA